MRDVNVEERGFKVAILEGLAGAIENDKPRFALKSLRNHDFARRREPTYEYFPATAGS